MIILQLKFQNCFKSTICIAHASCALAKPLSFCILSYTVPAITTYYISYRNISCWNDEYASMINGSGK